MRADAAGIMISIFCAPGWNPRGRPACQAIARDLVRHTLGFDGLVLTDDLDMKAIDQDMDVCMAQVLASGIDLALICHQGRTLKKRSLP